MRFLKEDTPLGEHFEASVAGEDSENFVRLAPIRTHVPMLLTGLLILAYGRC